MTEIIIEKFTDGEIVCRKINEYGVFTLRSGGRDLLSRYWSWEDDVAYEHALSDIRIWAGRHGVIFLQPQPGNGDRGKHESPNPAVVAAAGRLRFTP